MFRCIIEVLRIIWQKIGAEPGARRTRRLRVTNIPRQGPKSVGNLRPPFLKFLLNSVFIAFLTKNFSVCGDPPPLHTYGNEQDSYVLPLWIPVLEGFRATNTNLTMSMRHRYNANSPYPYNNSNKFLLAWLLCTLTACGDVARQLT